MAKKDFTRFDINQGQIAIEVRFAIKNDLSAKAQVVLAESEPNQLSVSWTG